jgi:hypothetical protein
MLTNDTHLILGALSTNESVPLLQADRRRHVYIIGMTGTGKTGLLINMMQADMRSGAGFLFLDPHGDASEHVASLAPPERRSDILYLDPSDPTHTFAYNPLSGVPPTERATAAANIVSAFKNIWADSWGPRLEYILGNALRLLLDAKDQTLLGLPRLLIDEDYRHWLVVRCQDPVIRSFWLAEYAGYDTRFRNEAIAPIQNKIGALLANPFIRAILCQNASTLKIAQAMDYGKVVIVNLSKGGLGSEPAHLLGALLITACGQAAEARRRIPEHERRDFTLYADEFQNFATESFASILSEARKWRLSLVAANQQIAQLPDSLQHAVFGNAGTLIAFRVGALDAKRLAAELGMGNPSVLTQTNNHHAWIRLMHHGAPLPAHLMQTFAPPSRGPRLAKVVAFTHASHMMPRAPVEERIVASIPRPPTKWLKRGRRRDPDWN